MMKQVLIVLWISVMSVAGWAQTDVEQLRQQYLEKFEEFMKKSKTKGLSFVLVSKDSVVMKFNLGYSDDQLKEKVSSETLFGLGSVTKVFTGAAVMQLVDQGKVELDKPLQQYLPQFQIKGEHRDEVTVRNVMTHHSGLPSDIIKGMFTQNPEHYEKTVEYMNKEYLALKPNQVRAYSNPGYTLLGHMLAEVSGKSYQEYMNENILSVLGMKSSGFNLRDEASATFNRKGKPAKDVLLRDVPAGGLYSNSQDMIKYLQAYLIRDEKLFSSKSYNQIFTEQHVHLPLDFNDRYALGWTLTSRSNVENVCVHMGTTLYYNSAVAVAPEVGLAAVVLTNSKGGGGAYNIAMAALNDVSREMGLSTNTGKESGKVKEFETKEIIELPGSVTDQYVGMYGAPGAILKIYKKGDRLFSTLQGLKVRLLPVAENEFIPKIMILGFIPIKLSESRFIFEEVAGYQVITQSELGSAKELMAKRIDSYEIGESWRNRLGVYKTVNKLDGELDFFTDFELIERDGLLIITFSQGDQDIEMALDIINDSRAKVSGIGRYAGQSLQVNNDTLLFFGLDLQKQK